MKIKDNSETPKNAGTNKKPLPAEPTELKPERFLQSRPGEPFVLSSLFDFKKRLLSFLLISGQLIHSGL